MCVDVHRRRVAHRLVRAEHVHVAPGALRERDELRITGQHGLFIDVRPSVGPLVRAVLLVEQIVAVRVVNFHVTNVHLELVRGHLPDVLEKVGETL